jgi:hypothetical protein
MPPTAAHAGDPATHPSPTPAAQRADELQSCREMLLELAEIGMSIARALPRQVAAAPEGQPPTPPDQVVAASVAFDRVARAIRRTVALISRLHEPDSPLPLLPAAAAERRLAARKRLIRGVEDAIQREARGDWAEALNVEFRERLDDPDLDDDLGQMPVNEVIAIVCRDLGIAHVPGTHPWKRRTPRDVLDLCALAARPPRDTADGYSAGDAGPGHPTTISRLVSPPPVRAGAGPPPR